MKRIRMILLCLAVLISVVAAFSTQPMQNCTSSEQYFYNGFTYIPAGDFGYDYFCLGQSGICTYYKPDPFGRPFYFLPCRLGSYVRINP